MSRAIDVAVVGAGIMGLAHALAAVRLGKRVAVFERDARCVGASIRNFGFVTVTGQQAGDCWTMARRARDVWAEVAPQAGIEVLHEGLIVTARRPESEAVIDAFLQTEMAEGCRRLTRGEASRYVPAAEAVTAALHSPHELRVESRDAIPRLAEWLEVARGVDFHWETEVHGVDAPRLDTSRGPFEAETVILCPGDRYSGPFAERIAAYAPTRCKLQMLRLRPERPASFRAAAMSDLGLARYLGYAELEAAGPLKALLDREQAAQRRAGVHLIVVQSGDGSLVVGDSHDYHATPDPFGVDAVDDLILEEMHSALALGPCRIEERWSGTYATADGRWRFTDAPDAATRIAVVTAGCGASTAFGIGEETLAGLYG